MIRELERRIPKLSKLPHNSRLDLLPTCCHLWGRDDDASQYAIKSYDREGTQSLQKRREPPQTLPPCTAGLLLGGDILRALK
jgi:hypothetical protein